MLTLGICGFSPDFDTKRLPLIQYLEKRYNVCYSSANPDLLIFSDYEDIPNHTYYKCNKVFLGTRPSLHGWVQGIDLVFICYHSTLYKYIPYPAMFESLNFTKQVNSPNKFACYMGYQSEKSELFRQLKPRANEMGLEIDIAPNKCDIKYLSQYKYCLCEETQTAPGFFSHNLFLSLIAGIIPVYVTDRDNFTYLNRKAGIYGTHEEIPEMVARVLTLLPDEYDDMIKEKPFALDLSIFRDQMFTLVDRLIVNIAKTNIPIYCINLSRSPERWSTVSQNAAEVGMSLIRVPAIDRNNYLVDHYRGEYTIPDVTQGQLLSTVASFASHIKAIRTALEQLTPLDNGFIICEDDILFIHNFKQLLLQALSTRPSKVGCLLLGYIPYEWNSATWHDPKRNSGWFHLPHSGFSGCQMYWLTPQFAMAILDKYDKCWDRISCHLPDAITAATLIKYSQNNGAWLHHPPLVLEQAGVSTITDRSTPHRRTILQQFNYLNYTQGDQYVSYPFPLYKVKAFDTRLTQARGPPSGPAEIIDMTFTQIKYYYPMSWMMIKVIPGDPHVREGEVYYGLVRYANYVVNPQSRNQMMIFEPEARAKNRLLLFGLTLKFKSRHIGEIPDFTPDGSLWEDCRAFNSNKYGEVWVLGVNTQLSDCRLHMVLGKINLTTLTFERKYPINRHPEQNREKSWLPLNLDATDSTLSAQCICGFAPFQFGKITAERGEAKIEFSEIPQRLDLSGLSGSCGLLPFAGGWLALTHTSRYYNEQILCRHQFLWLDTKYQVQKTSASFYFEFDKVEFCQSWFQQGDIIHLTVTSAVFYPKLVRITVAQVSELLKLS